MNEKDFDAKLKQLGDLYEEGKDCLHKISIVTYAERLAVDRLFEIMQEIRNLAAVALKGNREVQPGQQKVSGVTSAAALKGVPQHKRYD